MTVELPTHNCATASLGGSLTKHLDTTQLPAAVSGWLRSFRYSPRSIALTETQKVVCQCVACGLSDKEIAFCLGMTFSTVKAHNANIFRALGLARRAQLVRFVFERGEFDPDSVEVALRRRNSLNGGRKQKSTSAGLTSLP